MYIHVCGGNLDKILVNNILVSIKRWLDSAQLAGKNLYLGSVG
jgi:hypothetical protein